VNLPEPAPAFHDLLEEIAGQSRLEHVMGQEVVSAEPEGRYLHWDELRRRAPPPGLTSREWWFRVLMARSAFRTTLPLSDNGGTGLRFSRTIALDRGVHEIDRGMGKPLEHAEVATPELRDRYLIRSLVEESISSSQLEGASTTRQVAKELLLTGRKPRSRDERMIANNFEAMELIRDHLADPLSLDFVLEVHRVLTEGTLAPGDVGRFRRKDEPVVVQDAGDGQVLHVPPDVDQLPERMADLVAFANGAAENEVFVHPFVRSAALHFMLSYEHPFVDGNGRTARALFYWSMLRQQYWLTEFLAISRIIQRAPARYARAFLHCETGDGDLTYFVLHQLEVVLRATRELFEYVERKEREVQETERVLKGANRFNHRQRVLLSHALRHPDAEYLIGAHQREHGVAYQTARQDLLDLARAGHLVTRRRGHAFVFEVAPRLARRARAR